MTIVSRAATTVALGAALVLVIASPAAAAPWSSTQTISGTEWGLSSTPAAIGQVRDTAALLTSTSQRFGVLTIDTFEAFCDTATASVDTDAATGDILVTCDAQESDSFGLFVTPSYRLYAGGDLARLVYAIENRSLTDITVGDFFLSDTYDDFGNYLSSNGLTNGILSSTDTWIVTSGLADSTVAGSAWAVTGNAATVSSGTVSTGTTRHDFTAKTFATGSTTHVAAFVSIAFPLSPYSSFEQQDAVLAAASEAVQFDTFSGRLIAGLAHGTTVLNWGTVSTLGLGAPAPASTLPPTGPDGLTILALGAASVGAIALGVVIGRSRPRRSAS